MATARAQDNSKLRKTSTRLVRDGVYPRAKLRKMFGITDATINTGIFKPKQYSSVWLFITKNKTKDRTPYEDHLEGDRLEMQGQLTRKHDHFITDHVALGIEVLVFYRESKTAHPGAGFEYKGVFTYAGHPAGFVDEGAGPARYVLLRVPEARDSGGARDELVDEEEAGLAFGQGTQLSTPARMALERHAMDAAKAHFEAKSFRVRDESRGKPYDLKCTRRNETLYVEVKGTTSAGRQIRITRGELLFNEGNSACMALFLLHSVKLTQTGNDVQVRGGKKRVIMPWRADDGILVPISFNLTLR